MKRLIALALLVCLLALAAQAEGLRDAVRLNVEGRELTLAFDPSEEYSVVSDGLARASFYTYASQPDRLYELTLLFPADVRSGDVIDTAYALAGSPECSVVAIFTNAAEVNYYFAGVVDGTAYPDESSFAITFDTVTGEGGDRTYTGRITASLVGMDMYSDSDLKYYQIADAPFSFTMPAGNRIDSESDPDDGYNPFDPGSQPTPAPTPEVRRV